MLERSLKDSQAVVERQRLSAGRQASGAGALKHSEAGVVKHPEPWLQSPERSYLNPMVL